MHALSLSCVSIYVSLLVSVDGNVKGKKFSRRDSRRFGRGFNPLTRPAKIIGVDCERMYAFGVSIERTRQ